MNRIEFIFEGVYGLVGEQKQVKGYWEGKGYKS